jgi:hypothetical protein
MATTATEHDIPCINARPARLGRWPEDAIREHPGTTIPFLHSLEARAEENGLAEYLITIHGKRYVDLNGLDAVLKSQRQVA